MKKLFLSIAAVTAIALSAVLLVPDAVADGPFSGSGPITTDLLGGTPLVITAGATSNLTVKARVGQYGFSVMPRVIATNASTAVVAVQVGPVNAKGEVFGTLTQLGTVTLNGTTVVPGFVNTISNYNAGQMQITLTNGHTASIIVSNVYITAP